MSEPKTKMNDASVLGFINRVEHPVKKSDSLQILQWMREITGVEPKMWGGSIVGFDTYHYVYASGKEGDWPIVGFSPRKQNISIYIMPGFEKLRALLEKLGKHKTSKSCLYINKLADVDVEVLQAIISSSVNYMREKYH